MEICANLRTGVFRSLFNKTHRSHITARVLRDSRSCHVTIVRKEEETPLLAYLRTRILATGPFTVHDYMADVLTNSQGYYMHRDMFGAAGDFTTSPEISQMFGEMIGVWFLNEWLEAGSPQPVQIVEAGPGRGTLIADILRVFSKYTKLTQSLTVHLIEVSPHLSTLQEEHLCGTATEQITSQNYYKESKTRTGSSVRWYKDIHLVPQGNYTFYLAHEFLDALPIHKFERTDQGWREVLVDLDDSPTSPLHLRLVLAPGRTPSTVLIDPGETRSHIEVCPQAGMFVQHLAKRLEVSGGVFLLVDYGHIGEKGDTFRAFKKHQIHDPLSMPGQADLTADVDFAYLRRCVQDQVLAFGPVTQGSFLKSMGIGVRLKKLLETVRTPEEGKQLLSAYDMLTNPRHMGERFKFMAMLPKKVAATLDRNAPAGFEDANNAFSSV
ncbi:protein arginine methyltransferase NDUFAF7, mitochondrial-like isoform X2 [Varroa jacobsoni]|uniref:protein arginine methyltransferase NDUFAF7, mitochondrial-like isoform X2 n=1 Tax=Varroa jacobsoni TaxID=62625 RepID=UPI000BF53A6B|nr:protein arginine methyltransferase NDUFAF7, mitochondrial-like isoform X2 [Varroa jacobsoni]